ncbi:nidogen-2 isoform X5 [Poecilia latipinna]|uniref:nidogen-2 isoform X5 n=1 Tax=Poecilia latipinna TaxID=48699 RepID=UPI00072EACF5|nr:PREDICTED: nidogen-2 isoform X5 [Poecilia latipinna]
MDRGAMLTAALLCCWSCTVCVVTAIRRTDLFPFGDLNGDLILPEGDDETSRALTLPRPFYFFDSPFSQLYVATNGIVSAQDLPMEKQYVDDGLPTDFPVVAPFLADIDTSGGRGNIYYRVTETPSILNRFAQEVHRGFPDAKFTPTHAVVATWENVAAYEEQARANGATNKVNTFQTVIGYDETDSYVLFLYPEDGLNFYGTRPKESYNVEIEFPARVGFSRGEVSFFIISKTDGPFYSVAQDENSVKRLSQVGNTGVPGVWLFHTGKRFSFQEIIPASIGGLLAVLPTAGYGLYLDSTTPEYEFDDYNFEPESQEEVDAAGSPDSPNPRSEDSDRQLSYSREDVPLTLEPVERQYAPPGFPLTVPEGGTQRVEEQQPQLPLEVLDVYPPLRSNPPLSPGGHVVSVDEDDVDFDTGVIQYTTENKETCARFQQQCSQNAFCSDYPTGFCCHCQPGFYGNGRHCLPDGAPQRVSGKVSGTVTVGSTPVELNNIDLHAYIVVADGRAYTAISEVPEPVGWAMMSVSPVGELFGWLFALELPNGQAGFKITGAEFSRHAEVVFSPGNQRLSITQTGRGLDEHNHLTVDTVISGNVPFVPPGAEVTVKPFKETYQYYPFVTTSSSVREFSVGLPEKVSESYTFHLKQNITYRDCRHGNRAATPETLQINMERVFVMYVKEERILRYAITNKISPVGDSSEVELLNPCYAGNHDCDTTAQCIPLEGQAFRCQCATGYRGDGQNCYDIDECAEGLNSCGDYSQCLNLPGTHRCQCQSGFELSYESRTCVDIDECSSSPCHISARCVNAQGSFQCQCLPGFHGDGFLCSPQAVHLRSQCEEHRDSLQSGGQPSVGAYIPQCDSDGQYRPRQCHGFTGYCWCVDSRGQEKPGTRTPPGTAPPACDSLDKPERPKTQCERHRDRVQTSSADGFPVAGAYVPQCDENGQYRQLQCHSSTGYCWCVDSQGEERPGTRTPPGTPPTDCDKPERPRTQCEHHRDSVQNTGPLGPPVVGTYIPECDENGLYVPKQCHDLSGYCWCVDSSGQERSGTRTGPGSPSIDCRIIDHIQTPKTHCQRHRDSVQTTGPDGLPVVGAYVPQCDEIGSYLPQQCHGSTGYCWCVDSRGQERAGTRTGPGSPSVDCTSERPKTLCERHRDSIQTSSDGFPPPGSYAAQCDENGLYYPKQCDISLGQCWCVDNRGQERAGTRTGPGSPRVECRRDEPERPKTHCEHHRDSVLSSRPDGLPLVGAYVPRCDENGLYVPKQCHFTTGYCWCVDSSGQERAGTRIGPGSPRVECRTERPKTHCEHHRDSVQTTGPDGLPLLGVYVPQCDENGLYVSQQCHGSTGYCWCVDDRGQELPETRTAPGARRVDCSRTEEPERRKTLCEHHRDSVPTTSPDGVTLFGAYVPQCDENGLYVPKQCHGSTGYCWCVDSRGQERTATRTGPGLPSIDCRFEEPEAPKTHCQRHRDSVQTTGPDGLPVVGAYVPQCDEIGSYLPQQCHGSTGYCWCVDSRGQERAGTRTGPGSPSVDCTSEELERPKTLCERHRDSIQTSSDGLPPPGIYIPQCDENGLYLSQQCHGSTGYCWCVNSSGQERIGTRTGPGSLSFDCRTGRTDQSERLKTPCEHHKERVQASSSREYPVAGAYVPQCDADGQYIPLQCHSSTGYCWCVNEDGQERAGTRTPPGAQPRDCAKPDALKTLCEEQRDRAQASIQKRYPVAGVFVPRCDAQGQFLPQQCHESTGHCWCVDSSGQERAGTRTAPGATPADCRKPAPTSRAESVCERWRASLIEHYGGNPDPHQYLPQCEPDGEFSPVQCYGESTYCWCVDQEGREVPGTRSQDAVKPACLPSVAPPIVRPVTRPDVTPPAKTAVTLLYAQGQKIGALPLNGSRLDAERSKTLLTLHGSIVVGIAYDCKENKVYWTDLSARTINRASMASGAEPEMLINTKLVSPEGLALDAKRRLMFWVDSNTDVIESASLDGSRRRTLFDSDLVNPRAIVVVSSTGSLFWTDWNREAPKIETSTVDGQGRRVVVSDGIGLPNALTYDLSSGQICWADAGTKRLECISPNGSGRRVINSDLNYPFSMVYHSNHFYFSDWRRDGVIAVDKDSSKFTDEYLPEQRSHLYGITIATTHCLPGSL